MSYTYRKTLEEARKLVIDFDRSRNGRESTRQDLINDGRYNKSHIKKMLSEVDDRIRKERKQTTRQIDKLRERALIQLDERHSILNGDRPPRDLVEIFNLGFRLNESDYVELIGRYSSNMGALRLITEHAEADGFVVRGVPSKAEEKQALENHFNALRGFVMEDDSMKRRYLDGTDIESQELKMTASLDMRKVEVIRQPKNFVEDWNQSLAYEEKLKQLDHDRDNPFEAEIVGAIFDRDEGKAKKILQMEEAMKKTEAERKSAITDNLTDDMKADVSWMRVYRNQDPGGDITDAELSWLTSKDYREMYSARARQNGKENDYPSFLGEFQPGTAPSTETA